MKYQTSPVLALNQSPSPSSTFSLVGGGGGDGTNKKSPPIPTKSQPAMTTYYPLVKYTLTGEGDLCSSPASSNYCWMIGRFSEYESSIPQQSEQAIEPQAIATSSDYKKRSSSLKTLKNDEASSSEKKIVRFADSLGLDLADVKLFLDEIPNVPKSAFRDLQVAIETRNELKSEKLVERTLLPSFHNPGDMGDFIERVDKQKVLLESSHLTEKKG